MSHFCCFVITPTKPTESKLAEILQPWHEFECDGIRDEYVIEVDVTDRVIEEFNTEQTVVVMPDGKVYSRWNERFYTKEPEKKGPLFAEDKEFELPEGAEIKKMSAEEARAHEVGYKTLSECAKGYFGSDVIERDSKFYDLTNPNKKWDGWSIGGRWTGKLHPNYNPEDDPLNKEVCNICGGKGKRTDAIALASPHLLDKCNGCDGEGIRTKWPTEWVEFSGDQLPIKDIPLVTLRDKAETNALKRYDDAHKIIAGREIPVWSEIYKKHKGNPDKAREEYNNNPIIIELREAGILKFFDNMEEFTVTREHRARLARANTVCPFAYVLDGKWYERGEMGWWGLVSNEKDKKTWAEGFEDLLNELPDTTWITVCDCHI